MEEIKICIGDRVQTLKGKGTVSFIDNDNNYHVDLDNDHGSYIFTKNSIFKLDNTTKKSKTFIVPSLATHCIICGESVELSKIEEEAMHHGLNIGSKVCNKCKQSILHMRELLDTNTIIDYLESLITKSDNGLYTFPCITPEFIEKLKDKFRYGE